jgi:hypothetical protein
MPSAFSAKDNKALIAVCLACQKITPTSLMISLAGRKWQAQVLCRLPLVRKQWLASAGFQRTLSTTL